jgi:cob(I)alamin adenosyltransferase
VKIYTRRGDDGTTGLFHGGSVDKDGTGPEAYGTVDETVSALGTARAAASEEMATLILEVQRELFVVGAELATDPARRDRLEAGKSLVTEDMVESLEVRIDRVVAAAGLPDGFIVPGGTEAAAGLDLARSIARRAERRAVHHHKEAGITGSAVVPYLNRLADYLYVLARAAEGSWVPSRRDEEGAT